MANKTESITVCLTPEMLNEFEDLKQAEKKKTTNKKQINRRFSNSGFATQLIEWALKNFGSSVNQNLQNGKR